MSENMNLDYLAAKYSQKVVSGVDADKLEIAVTKTLGILQTEGIYGCFLFTLSRSGPINKQLGNEETCYATLIYEGIKLLNNTFDDNRFNFDTNAVSDAKDINKVKDQILEHISENFCKDQYRNHLAQTILERYLIYTRYHAKGKKVEEPSVSSDSQEDASI